MNRSRLIAIARIVVTLALMIALFTLVIDADERRRLVEQIERMNIGFYLLGLATFCVFICIWTMRWRYLLRSAGDTTPYTSLLATTLVGNFFALFLPEAVGSDVARATRGMQSATSASFVSTVLLDRVVGLVSLTILAGVALVLGSNIFSDQTAAWVIAGVAVFFVVGWVLFFNRRFMDFIFGVMFRLPLLPRLEKPIRSLYEALYNFHNRPRILIQALLMSLVVQSIEIASVVLLGQALGLTTPLPFYFIVMPIAWLVITIPISISGLGVREAVFALFLAQVGVSEPDAVALSLLYYSFKVVTGVIGGVIWARLSAANTPQSEPVVAGS
jgi:hypothetical protein